MAVGDWTEQEAYTREQQRNRSNGKRERSERRDSGRHFFISGAVSVCAAVQKHEQELAVPPGQSFTLLTLCLDNLCSFVLSCL